MNQSLTFTPWLPGCSLLYHDGDVNRLRYLVAVMRADEIILKMMAV